MEFAILTTTHRRPAELLRAIVSVRMQSFSEYTHYIINDSPEYDYSEVEKSIQKDPKIVYIKNTENIGKNASLNNTLQVLSAKKFEGCIVYLDDDDWLSPECLADFKKSREENKGVFWFVSNRSLVSGESLTKNNTNKKTISYFFDYLIFKKFKGDTTHCVEFSKAKRAHYPIHIRNGEEWYYFLLLSKYAKEFLYIEKTGTYTDGYSLDGLNTHMKEVYSTNTQLLFKENQTLFTFAYLIPRSLILFFKKIF